MNRQLFHWSLDPVEWSQDQLSFNPDPWQSEVLRSPTKRKAFNCARQSGKSTIAAIKALHRSIFYPSSLILLISPSQRQSGELFRKVHELLDGMEGHPSLIEDNKTSFQMDNRSRIISLPSSEKTIRGYSKVNLVIEDESAAVPDATYQAVRPMLAVSNGEYIMLSTPRGKTGHFYESCIGTEYEITTVPAELNPRIGMDFLESEKRALGTRIYNQEYECLFLDDIEGSLFKREWFDIVDDFPATGNVVRRWDMAATSDGGDFTAGIKMVEYRGQYWIADLQHGQLSALGNRELVKQTAIVDTTRTPVRMEQEPGSSGVYTIDSYARDILQGYDFKGVRSTGDKLHRAMPFSAACEAHNVKLVRGAWNKAFLDEVSSFPMGAHDDIVDACSGAFSDLNDMKKFNSSRFAKVRTS